MSARRTALRRPPDHRRARRSPGARSSATCSGSPRRVGGMRRRVWAWPVGIVGNVLLFTVFLGATFADHAQAAAVRPGRPAGVLHRRSASTAGGAGAQTARRRRRRRRRSRRAGPPARSGRRTCSLRWPPWSCAPSVFRAIGAGWPAPRWYYWCDAWILVGSMLATYAMARGWVDFWLVWIAVDVVGVPLLLHSQLLPVGRPVRRLRRASCVWGFVAWLRASRGSSRRRREPATTGDAHERRRTVRLDTDRAGGRRHRAPAGRSSSSTTRTARTRAT